MADRRMIITSLLIAYGDPPERFWRLYELRRTVRSLFKNRQFVEGEERRGFLATEDLGYYKNQYSAAKSTAEKQIK